MGADTPERREHSQKLPVTAHQVQHPAWASSTGRQKHVGETGGEVHSQNKRAAFFLGPEPKARRDGYLSHHAASDTLTQSDPASLQRLACSDLAGTGQPVPGSLPPCVSADVTQVAISAP